MSFQPVRFYQTGTFTVGNRLLDENNRSVQATQARDNSLNSGHRACQGCGEALGARYAIDAAMAASNRIDLCLQSALGSYDAGAPDRMAATRWSRSAPGIGSSPAE